MKEPIDRGSLAANRLLASLPQKESKRLLPHLEVVSLETEQLLWQAGEVLSHVYFPAGAVVTTIVPMKNGTGAEAGMIGSEGMLCLCTFLGCSASPFRAIVQNPGKALRMSREAFHDELPRCGTLHRFLSLYANAFLTQVSYSAACNSLHSLEQRSCRWLLMTDDRAEPDHFHLTQVFLARMLGANRISVTEVARKLQQAGSIRYSWGKVTVVDRKGLEANTCECYEGIKAAFDFFK